MIATNNINELKKDLITQRCFHKLYVLIGLDIIFYIAFCHERSGVILAVECTTYVVRPQTSSQTNKYKFEDGTSSY